MPPSAIPAKHVVIVTCMDSRVDPLAAFGLEHGDAHLLRNAGAVASDDVLRSLVLSQRLLETTTVHLMAHTDCGLRKVHDEEMAKQLERETGEAPPFAVGAFFVVETHVRELVARVRDCPWLPHVDEVHGWIYDVSDGSVREVV
jgi:carbonic anhydrase